MSTVLSVLRSLRPLKFNRVDWGGEGWGKWNSEEIPLVGRYGWEPAPATDLSNMFFNCSLRMIIEFGLVEFNVKAGEAGKPSTRAIDTVIQLKIIEEYSCVDVGQAEVFAEGRLEPLRMISASSVLISDGDVKADDTMSPQNGGEVEGDGGAGGRGVCCTCGGRRIVDWVPSRRWWWCGWCGLFICDVGGAGRRTRGIDEGWSGEELEKEREGLSYSVPAQQKDLANI